MKKGEDVIQKPMISPHFRLILLGVVASATVLVLFTYDGAHAGVCRLLILHLMSASRTKGNDFFRLRFRWGLT